MYIGDSIRFSFSALAGYRLRSALMLLAMAIGVSAVILLTALGEAARHYVASQFSSLGTNLLIVIPGKNETRGGAPPMTAETPRDLTLDDASALLRSHYISVVAPITIGAAPVSWNQRGRESTVIGTSHDYFSIRQLNLAQGRFLPALDLQKSSPICVLGSNLRQELFGSNNALGQWVRVGDSRFRVIGILSQRGVSLGIDTDDMIVIPVASAQRLLNTSSLFRIMVSTRHRENLDLAKHDIERILKQRHDDEEDVTVISQDSILTTFDNILLSLTYGVAGIASISLLVAGVLIMNIMLIAISQRTAEIGLLKAIGAPARTIIALFVIEASWLALIGATAGLALGMFAAWLIGLLYPALHIAPPWWSIISAILVALITGIAFSIFPARRAAALDPVLALSRR